MSRFTRTVQWAENYPHLVVQVALSVCLIITGLYIVGPWYVGGVATVFVYFDSDLIRLAAGFLYFGSGTANLFGVAKHSVEWRYWGTLAVFLSFVAMTLLRLLTFGFTPITWVLMLTLAVIAAIKHVGESHRRELING